MKNLELYRELRRVGWSVGASILTTVAERVAFYRGLLFGFPPVTGGAPIVSNKHTCRGRHHIPPLYFSQYDFSFSLVAKNGNDYTHLPHVAARETCSNISSTKRAVKWLVKTGWYETVKKPTKGRNGAGVYRVLSHDEYVAKYGRRHKGSECVYLSVAEHDAELIRS